MAVLVTAMAGCLQAPKKPTASAAPDLSDQLKIGCYTVDLFQSYSIEYPGAGVPPQHAKFLGVWKDGAWNGTWCHDLYVTDVRADGTVTVLDAYGPNLNRGWEAQIYKRTGRIEDDVLKFDGVLGAKLEYRLVGDFLVGQRKDFISTETITMSKTGGVAVVPIPPKNPRRG